MQDPLPTTVKIGRSEFIIERHFVETRTVTDAIYELLRVEDTLKAPDNLKDSDE